MTKFKTGLAALLAFTAVITTAIPIAAAETDSNKPPLSQEMIQHRQEMAQKIADLLGIDVATLKTEREAGKTIMEIAEEQGASDEVIQQLKDMRKQLHGQKNNGHKRLPKAALEKVAAAMGISVDDLVAKLKSGEKLKDLAEEYGVDLKALKEQFKADHQSNSTVEDSAQLS